MISCHVAVRLAAELTETSASSEVSHLRMLSAFDYVLPWSELLFFLPQFPCDMPAKHWTVSPVLSCFFTALLLPPPSLLPCLAAFCLLLGFILSRQVYPE